MSPPGCQKMSAKPCNRNAEESFPVLNLKSREQKPPNSLLIQDKDVLQPRRSPLSRKTAWLMIRDYGKLADLPVEAHPHMLRHACGFALADQGADTRLIQDYLGHRNIQHTVMYTATNPARFERLWR